MLIKQLKTESLVKIIKCEFVQRDPQLWRGREEIVTLIPLETAFLLLSSPWGFSTWFVLRQAGISVTRQLELEWTKWAMCQLSAYNSDGDIKETLWILFYFFNFKELQRASRILSSIKLWDVSLRKGNVYSRKWHLIWWNFSLFIYCLTS